MRSKLVAGNWKMNGSLGSNQALLSALIPALGTGGCADYAVCVPFPYLQQVRDMLKGSRVALGAQDVSQFESGAYTGAVSAAMLADFGCRLVIVGHSERRGVFGETDAVVALKFGQAAAHGLMPVLCVGETLAEREAGVTESIVVRQIDAVIDRCGVAAFERSIVAYEPVWAIGTGKTATPEQAQAVHAAIRARFAAADQAIARRLPILYGGSVKAGNAKALFELPDVDGGLIGGASLVADEFVAICRAAAGINETAKV
jgi:triosephosphate isomerase (TIM)